MLLIVPLLVNVAFFTLLERKVLSLCQLRKGPNKVYFLGILQPFADAVKLFLKEQVIPYNSNKIIFYFSPLIRIFLRILLWNLIPNFSEFIRWKLSVLVFLLILGIRLYPLLLSGWRSHRKYATLGSLRGVAQTISYEIRLALIVLSLVIFNSSVRLSGISYEKRCSYRVFLYMPLLYIWLLRCLAETNRTPSDFSEGESDLVSGFNVEYGSGSFALIFMAEYSSILLLRFLTVIFFFPSSDLLVFVQRISISFWWVWVRGSYPRYRYDKLINLAWKNILPLSLSWLRIPMCLFLL